MAVGTVSQEGHVYTWGDNTFGQLGVPATSLKHSDQPVRVTSIAEEVKQISMSNGEKHCHTACVTVNGNLYTWGDQYKGQLGTLKEGWGHSIKDTLVGP